MAPPRAEELLSYFTGLAPVGDSVAVHRIEVMADLRLDHTTYGLCLNHLVGRGFVRRVAKGVIEVIRRPEEYA